MGKLYFVDLPLVLLISLYKSGNTIVLCTKREVWWLISALNAVHWASLPVELCPLLQLWVTNLQIWGCQQEHPPGRKVFKYTRQVGIHAVHVPTSTQTQIFSISYTITHMYTILLPFYLPLSHTHTYARNFTSPGICSFYRVAVCWHGWRYGRTVSPSSDWISDQYPVPCQPASSGRTDCFWKPVLVVSRLPSLIIEKKSDCYLPSCNTCHTIFLHVLFENHNLVLVAKIDLGLHAYIVYLMQRY